MRRILGASAFIILAAIGVAAQAKPEIKSTTRITVAAPTLPAPFEITSDSTLLSQSHVYQGSFIGAITTAPDAALPRYTITFDIQTLDGVKQSAYVVQYCMDSTGEGYVYLPGRGDPAHRRNISTILRDGQDGYWHRASGEWSAAIRPYLP
jgi:hypothetical protein